MTTIRIDQDCAAAVKAGRMTHAEAWEVTELRRESDRLTKRIDTRRSELDPLEARADEIEARLFELETKLAVEEPKSDA